MELDNLGQLVAQKGALLLPNLLRLERLIFQCLTIDINEHVMRTQLQSYAKSKDDMKIRIFWD